MKDTIETINTMEFLASPYIFLDHSFLGSIINGNLKGCVNSQLNCCGPVKIIK